MRTAFDCKQLHPDFRIERSSERMGEHLEILIVYLDGKWTQNGTACGLRCELRDPKEGDESLERRVLADQCYRSMTQSQR